MSSKSITSHTELTLRIMHLKASKAVQEEELQRAFKEFTTALNPGTMVRDTLHSLAGDEAAKFDMAKIGLKTGANIIVDKVFGKNRSLKGFLSSIVVENISAVFINSNASRIVSGINQFFHRNTVPKNNQQ